MDFGDAILAAAAAGGASMGPLPDRGPTLGPWDPPKWRTGTILLRMARQQGEPDPERDPEGYRRWEAARAKRERRAAKRRR